MSPALRTMQAAFFMVGVFPPPAAGADILSLFNWSCAGGTADTRIVLFVERIDGNLVLFDVFLNLFQRPVGDRVDLDQGRVVGIFTHLGNVRAGDVLVPADTGDPCFQIIERPR